MKVDINESLSTLTTIPESTFTKLENKIEWCISDAIEKAILNGEDKVEVDLGYGKLFISFTNKEIKYKFIPSDLFEKIIINTVMKEHNDLVLNIENSLVSKLVNTYKTFF